MSAVVDGEVSFEGCMMGGEGVAEVNIIVITAVRPLDGGVGEQCHPDSMRVAVGNEVRHLVKGDEQRFPQQRDVVKVKNSMESHHGFDNLHRRDVDLSESSVFEFQHTFWTEASLQDFNQVGFALGLENVQRIHESMVVTDGRGVSRGRERRLGVAGTGFDSGRSMQNFCDTYGGD